MQPKVVWNYFEKLSEIPRGSKNEQAVSDYLYQHAKAKGFEVIQDDVNNIIIRKPASPGYEKAPTIILQGHMDMVCEKNHGTPHDFLKDPIELIKKGDFLYAKDTTLGADNGIGVAMAMAVLDTDQHPALEVIITVDEEMGMTGAEHLSKDHVTGDYLINLDSEPEGIFTVGSAGGGRVTYEMPITYMDNPYKTTYKISVSGLSGGHSGVDIHLEKGNANKILGRVLSEIRDLIGLCEIQGGAMDNAIPREAEAVITTDQFEAVKTIIDKLKDNLRDEYKVTDPGVDLLLEITDHQDQVFQSPLKHQIIDAIVLTPNGVIARSTEIDLVITSVNLGVIKTGNTVEFILAPRSSVLSRMEDLINHLKRLGAVLDFEVKDTGYYPGWAFNSQSQLLEKATKVFEHYFDKAPRVEAIHAGLECGFFLEKKPNLEAISFGPDMYEIHTPNEHVSISSVERVYGFLLDLLKSFK